MNKKKLRKSNWLLPVLLCALFIAFVWFSGLGTNAWQWKRLELYGLDFGGAQGKSFYAGGNTEHRVLNSGPDFALEAGTYKLRWSIDTDGYNRFLITTSNGARIEPAEIEILPANWKNTQEITLFDDAENLQILVDYRDGAKLAIHDITLEMECTDRFFMLSLMAIALCALFMLDRAGYLTPERKKILLVIGLAVLFASIPALRENLNTGHDSEFHRSKLRDLAFRLERGQFGQRMGGYMFNSYGSAASIFYPELWLYVPALMMVGGATIQFALSFLYIAINAVTGLNMYICAKRIFGSRTAATCSAVLYVLAAYRLTDMHVRCAMGETPAMAMFPLFVLGLWEVIFGDKERWPMLTIGAMCVFQSHMISTGLAAVLAVGAGVCFSVKIVRERRVAAIVKAAVMTVLMGLFYLVPFFDYGLQGINAEVYMCSPVEWTLSPVQLFAPDPDFPRHIGVSLLFAAAMTLFAIAGKKGEKERFARICVFVGAVCCFGATDLFPWELARRLTMNMIDYLQFPWRLLILADVFLCIAGGYGLSLLAGDEKRAKEALMAGVLALCMFSSNTQIMNAVTDNDYYRFWKSNTDALLTYGGYQLPGASLSDTLDYAVYLSDGVTMEAYEKDGTSITANVKADTDGEIALPLYAFDGYRVTVDGREMDYFAGEKQRMTVQIPAGTQGALSVRFAGKTLWKIADGISLVSMLGLAVFLVKRRKAASSEVKNLQM